MTRIAINGFGRIGRLVTRVIAERRACGIDLVSINDLSSPASAAPLLRRDSVHGAAPFSVGADERNIVVDGKAIRFTAVSDPAALTHRADAIDLVLECTGRFATRDGARRHLAAGAGKVLVSAPVANADFTLVCGVNEDGLRHEHELISNASCTTNCLAPLVDTLLRSIGLERARMTTVHPYTNDQPLLDSAHKDPRRARAAALSIVPTSTGAVRALEQIFPKLAGRFSGASIRVPTPDVGLVDLMFVPARPASVAEINEVLAAAAASPRLRHILTVEDDRLVSADVLGNAASAVVDASATAVLDGRLARVLAWYDNEWAFANRMVDAVTVIADAAAPSRRPASRRPNLADPEHRPGDAVGGRSATPAATGRLREARTG